MGVVGHRPAVQRQAAEHAVLDYLDDAVTSARGGIHQRHGDALGPVGDEVVANPHQRIVGVDDGVRPDTSARIGAIGVAAHRGVGIACRVPELDRVGAEEDEVVAKHPHPHDLVGRGFCISKGQRIDRCRVVQGRPPEDARALLRVEPAASVERDARDGGKVGVSDLREHLGRDGIGPCRTSAGVDDDDMVLGCVDFAAAGRCADGSELRGHVVEGRTADGEKVPVKHARLLKHGADFAAAGNVLLGKRGAGNQSARERSLRRLLIDHVDQAGLFQRFLGAGKVAWGERNVGHQASWIPVQGRSRFAA